MATARGRDGAFAATQGPRGIGMRVSGRSGGCSGDANSSDLRALVLEGEGEEGEDMMEGWAAEGR